MADFNPKITPAQQGVQYESCAAPTFSGGDLVPSGETWSVKEGAEMVRSKDGGQDVDNIGTAGHHLVASGDFKVKKKDPAVAVPNKGDAVLEDGAGGRWWVITGDVDISAFSSGGLPMMVKLELEYHKKVHDALVVQNA